MGREASYLPPSSVRAKNGRISNLHFVACLNGLPETQRLL